ncbi:hypothetical protein PICMEDRAFT_14850 [Pichia membranifaciens NRRL Y-2026]|uniref:Alpha/beta hydrolase fold-3 domain-containing protein n=1 Tax=Pichia membranifaciens NRRL Y-2026 TaxID=763406 RepID=A0A1E3NTL7_9ASCO|nr:hypothetical protein PICMEDRAFT_14850 [Pichia membranifaciens NRRL Y-2026]ODQ49380.1 hypothetical protein PICMEDRAFT_14850 [Pichia membranifaciens NRRL Y-2026]
MKLVIDVFFMCYVEPLNVKDKVAQNAPFYQHALTRTISHYLKDLSSFEKVNPSYSMVSNIVWKYFFTTRAFIQSYNIIELSHFEELNIPEGILITAPCRTENHDLLIVYVPNIPLFGGAPFFYVEYLMTLHSLLLLQGFNSPSIFIMKFPEESKTSSMEYNLKFFTESLVKIVEQNPNSKVVLMGDSLGATLILNFLSVKSGVFFNEKTNDENNMNLDIDPYAVILLSPIVSFVQPEKYAAGNLDFLTQRCVDDMASNFCSNKAADRFNPAAWDKLEMWEKIVPGGGMVITFGDEELQSEKIDTLSKLAFKTERVKIMKAHNKGHCWQFISFLTEETQDEKEDSCFLLAGLISRMVIYKTETYRDPERAYEPMNLLTIDDDHL